MQQLPPAGNSPAVQHYNVVDLARYRRSTTDIKSGSASRTDILKRSLAPRPDPEGPGAA